MLTGSLADEVLRMIFAFDLTDSRREAVRDLAKRIALLEKEHAKLLEAPRPPSVICPICGADLTAELHRPRWCLNSKE